MRERIKIYSWIENCYQYEWYSLNGDEDNIRNSSGSRIFHVAGAPTPNAGGGVPKKWNNFHFGGDVCVRPIPLLSNSPLYKLSSYPWQHNADLGVVEESVSLCRVIDSGPGDVLQYRVPLHCDYLRFFTENSGQSQTLNLIWELILRALVCSNNIFRQNLMTKIFSQKTIIKLFRNQLELCYLCRVQCTIP